jgi:hypothetical protein
LVEATDRKKYRNAVVEEEVFMSSYLAPIKRLRMEDVFESAVVLHWRELLQDPCEGVVHVEFGTAPEPSLQYLKIWLSTKEKKWDLICEYWMCPGSSSLPASGLTFSNGYHSSGFGQILENVLRPRDGNLHPLAGKTGVNLILVESPTEDDRRKARSCMSEAYGRIGLEFAETAGRAA